MDTCLLPRAGGGEDLGTEMGRIPGIKRKRKKDIDQGVKW